MYSFMKMLLFLAPILLMMTSSSAAKDPPNGWKCKGDHCYTYLDSEKKFSPTIAKTTCEYFGGTLPMPKTQDLETLIISTVPDDNMMRWIWIGLDNVNGLWADGEEFNGSYTNWFPGYEDTRRIIAMYAQQGRTSELWFGTTEVSPTYTVLCEAPRFCTKPNTMTIAGECVALETEPKTWNQAQAACEAEGPGVTLTSLQSQLVKENIFQRQTQPSSTRAWLGATDAAKENTWLWTATGKVADIDPSWWGQGQPDNWNGNENCLLVRPDGKLNDANCNWKLPYYCSRRLRPLVPGS